MDWGTVAIALVPAVLAFLGSMLLHRPQRNKLRADAAGVLVGAGLEMVERLEEQVTALECKVNTQDSVIAKQAQEIDNLKTRLDEMEAERDRLEQENSKLLEGVARLTDQIVGHGYNPAWRPDVEVSAPKPGSDEGNRGLASPFGGRR